MSRALKPRLPGLLVAAAVLVVVAMSGSAVAASLITSKEIANGTIKMKDINKKTRAKLKGDSGPQGPQGIQGAKGDTGAPGPATGPAGGVLAGNYPNPTLAPEIERLTPVAAVVFNGNTGELNSEAHRAPVTGPPVITRSGEGAYRVELPGVDFNTQDDVANCTTSSPRLIGISSDSPVMTLTSSDHAGALADSTRVRCVIYDVG